MDFVHESKLILDVVPYLLRDHEGTSEFAGNSIALREFLEEAPFEIDFVVARAVEPPRRCPY